MISTIFLSEMLTFSERMSSGLGNGWSKKPDQIAFYQKRKFRLTKSTEAVKPKCRGQGAVKPSDRVFLQSEPLQFVGEIHVAVEVIGQVLHRHHKARQAPHVLAVKAHWKFHQLHLPKKAICRVPIMHPKSKLSKISATDLYILLLN